MPIFGPAGETDSTCSEARMHQQQTEKRKKLPPSSPVRCRTLLQDIGSRFSPSVSLVSTQQARQGTQEGKLSEGPSCDETCAIPCPYSARKKTQEFSPASKLFGVRGDPIGPGFPHAVLARCSELKRLRLSQTSCRPVQQTKKGVAHQFVHFRSFFGCFY